MFMEAAKLRAARQMWSKIMTDFGAKSERSKMLRTHCQTSGVSLTMQDPYNNVVRTTVEAIAATLGGTQSLHTNAFDEAIALPTETSARIARNTQLILQHETGITRVVDPLAGSYYVESLTKGHENYVPYILIAKMGQDGHDRGAKVVATSFADMGFKVDVTNLFVTPDEVADIAIEKGVDVIGVSSLAAGHKTLVPALINLLKAKNADYIKVVLGGVIPEQDFAFLKDSGVDAIFPPGSNLFDAANAVLGVVNGLNLNR